MMNKQEIIDLFRKFGAPITQDDVWQVQSATVIKHKALERLAAAAKIDFDPPQVLRAERDEAVILATGRLGDRAEWSIGEARVVRMVDTGRKNSYGKPIYEPAPDEIGNYQITPKQAAYVYAMAEKRAKDRVIIKLAGLHGTYSEDEADEFQEPAPQARQAGAGAARPPERAPAPADSPELSMMTQALKMCATPEAVDEWEARNAANIEAAGLSPNDAAELASRITRWRAHVAKRAAA